MDGSDREARRLDALRRSRLLETGRSPEFDAVAELARSLLDMPIAFISLLDEKRQWFKAACGLDLSAGDRQGSFCDRTILRDTVVVVEDARLDPDLADSPYVTGPVGLRFYAGAPVKTADGYAIGAICVADQRPRRAPDHLAETLGRLSLIASGLVRELAARSEAEDGRRTVEMQRRELEVRQRRFLQSERVARMGGWDLDLQTGEITWSDEMYRIYDLPIGSHVDLPSVMAVFEPSDAAAIRAAIDASIAEGMPFQIECAMRTASGQRKWINVAGETECHGGSAKRLFGVFQDITDRHEDRQRLWRAANTDALTGLANRHRFANLLREATVAASGGMVGLLVLDVDRLKAVNDCFGHHGGDALITSVAERLTRSCGDLGIACRIGGDEFAVLVPRCANAQVLDEIAARIMAAASEPVPYADQQLPASVSVGGALGQGPVDPEQLRRNADIALYHAKETRRGSYVSYREGLRTSITSRSSQIRTLSDALDADAVEAWYQPVVDLRTGRLEGFEALARLRIAGGVQSVGTLPLALEESWVAWRLTARMFDVVSHDLSGWLAAGIDVPRIGLNTSTADFRSDDIEERLETAFVQRGVPLDRLVLEITESVALGERTDAIADQLRRLRAAGVLISLDDFGTGYASLTHLRRFPVDTLKIDREFVAGMETDRVCEAVVRGIVDLGRRCGIEVVAEGIETVSQRDHLHALGCPFGQGYLFARPIPARDVGDFARSFTARGAILDGRRRLAASA